MQTVGAASVTGKQNKDTSGEMFRFHAVRCYARRFVSVVFHLLARFLMIQLASVSGVRKPARSPLSGSNVPLFGTITLLTLGYAKSDTLCEHAAYEKTSLVFKMAANVSNEETSDSTANANNTNSLGIPAAEFLVRIASIYEVSRTLVISHSRNLFFLSSPSSLPHDRKMSILS